MKKSFNIMYFLIQSVLIHCHGDHGAVKTVDRKKPTRKAKVILLAGKVMGTVF